MTSTTAHYTLEYRRTMIISAFPLLLTAFFSTGGLLYMVISGLTAQSESPPVTYWVLVGVFAFFAVGVAGNALVSVLRLKRNTLHLNETGLTFTAWQHFTLSAGWQQVARLEQRENERERVTVLILEGGELDQAPLARLLRREPPSPPYPLVLDRFEGWPNGSLRRMLETHIPYHVEGNGL